MTVFEKLDNLNRLANWLRDKGMIMRGCGPEDILDGNLNVILSVVWSIIMVSSVQPFDAVSTTDIKAKQLLLQWCQQSLQDYDLHVENFDTRFVVSIDLSLIKCLTHQGSHSLQLAGWRCILCTRPQVQT